MWLGVGRIPPSGVSDWGMQTPAPSMSRRHVVQFHTDRRAENILCGQRKKMTSHLMRCRPLRPSTLTLAGGPGDCAPPTGRLASLVNHVSVTHPLRGARLAALAGEQRTTAEVARRWFGALWDHVTAEKNGLREAPALTEPCSFLVVEDFGTVGLTGDVHSDDIDGAQNSFVDFLRSDGRTRKSTGEQGRWGVGTNVFSTVQPHQLLYRVHHPAR